MSENLLINITPQETRVALIFQGAVQELHIERTLSRGLVGNIYLGKVARVLPGMQSAFIDIGLERAAFLHVADIWDARSQDHHGSGSATLKPIEKLLFDGQSVTVQVIKDPIGTKGARLSTQISIAGRMLVYLPQDSHIGISQKIANEEEREALRNKVQSLQQPEDKGGFIVRTMAEDASDEDLKADVDYLRRTWSTITSLAKTLPPTSLLYQDLNLAQRVLRDFVNEDTAGIQVDSRENFLMLQEFAHRYMPSVIPKLGHYTGERPLFDLYGVEEEIERALGRRVDLKSGGYLIIDQTEAMTTIDVNTGSFVAGRNFDDTIFKTNLEAAHAIARQLRLRNLGGIIILDIIDMENEEHKSAVLSELNKALSRDRTKLSVSGFSALGLVEVTRKRTRESLAHVLCETCPACTGKGQVKTARTICYEILRELLREAKQFNPREFRIMASQVVVDMFLEEESQHLTMLGDFIGKPISLQVESMFHQEQYDIILM
ncbi:MULTISPECIES: ribonuclease G [unclassified Undibacterium]|uniref:ribonuclease G n=1 Tax=unclassified Undibacterium TaxID=2630295 RepID=UPI002AC954E0|nr:MULTISPECIES: ribonuclease G [unclassified Undibacterium]MEB0141120.1 ribonuclease G [Undibacterium sp. CCC2.1]MEB0174137.1 ribonuclease G [Undibacterium sp. CCC1.1]MEB0177832.1 ribonuclease G [Undibacterium sp. CCC3.4]MEB0217031.1 ribonuclease G [Undibacterium sp. 5I2]WPX41991.1 ribonuclease G [Undibacterium sp. CCC3.4]